MFCRQFCTTQNKLFLQRSYAKAKVDAHKTRAIEKADERARKKGAMQGGFLKQATGFRKKKKFAPVTSHGINAHERKYEEWNQYSSVINPDLKPVPRSQEDIHEAVTRTKEYTKMMLSKDKWFRKYEQKRLLLMKSAFLELPEDAKDAASQVDESFLPDNFIITRVTVPVVGEKLFGECQKPGYAMTIDEFGYPPQIPKIKQTPF